MSKSQFFKDIKDAQDASPPSKIIFTEGHLASPVNLTKIMVEDNNLFILYHDK